jgi:hypothetical protein
MALARQNLTYGPTVLGPTGGDFSGRRVALSATRYDIRACFYAEDKNE